MTYFYPRPPRGGRPSYFSLRAIPELFLSTPSVRRATVFQNSSLQRQFVFLSTPSARRATLRKESHANYEQLFLSTPSARRATPNVNENSTAFWHFYPRPPQGGRPPSNMSMLLANKFLSTPSARRATRRMQEPRETRSISIHALRKEGDAADARAAGNAINFYPRPPQGGRRPSHTAVG